MKDCVDCYFLIKVLATGKFASHQELGWDSHQNWPPRYIFVRANLVSVEFWWDPARIPAGIPAEYENPGGQNIQISVE